MKLATKPGVWRPRGAIDDDDDDDDDEAMVI